MPTVFVKPAQSREVDGPLRVYHPERGVKGPPIAAEGEEVPVCKWVNRRLRDGDLVIAVPESAVSVPSGQEPLATSAKPRRNKTNPGDEPANPIREG